MTIPLSGFAAAVLEMYEGKVVEINTGETSSTLLFDQENKDLKDTIRGIVHGALGDALILKCSVPGGHKTILINCYSIISVTSTNEPGMLKDCYFVEY